MLLSKSKEALSHILVLCVIQCPKLCIIKNYVCIGKVQQIFLDYLQVWGTALGTGDTGFTRTDRNPLSLEQTFLGRTDVCLKMQRVDQGQQGMRTIISL